jgi:hypothetical protein
MTERETIELIEIWIKEHSPFTAEVVSVTAEEHGAWVVQVECSEVIWQQTVSPEGEVSDPVWID